MFRRSHALVPGLLLAAALAPVYAGAQTVVLDEGTFDVFVDGRRVGTETFRIQRGGSGGDAVVISQAHVRLETDGGVVEMRPQMRAGPDLGIVAYKNDITGARTLSVNGYVDGQRFVGTTRSDQGELQKEYRRGPGTVVLDERVAHLYYYLTPHLGSGAGASLTAIVPSSGEQVRMEVLSSEVEPFRLGREQVETRHVRLGAGGVVHEVWLDDQGRVMRVEISDHGYRAERLPG